MRRGLRHKGEEDTVSAQSPWPQESPLTAKGGNEVQSLEGKLRSPSEGLRPGSSLKGESHVHPSLSWIPGGDGLGTFQISAHSQGQSREVRTSLPEPVCWHTIYLPSSALLWLVSSLKHLDKDLAVVIPFSN